MYRILAVTNEMFCCGLDEVEWIFRKRMSDEGVGGEAYSHERRKKESLYCYMCRILVVFDEMIVVDLTKQFLYFG